MKSLVSIAVLIVWAVAAWGGQDAPLEIELANGTEAEARTRDAILELAETYDIERWLFTRKVVIDESSIPHSHPVLTMHTRHLGDEPALLSTFLHEQFHWLEEARSGPRDRAIEEFQALFPDAPYGRPDGGRDQQSTYLHLIVCDLELQAATELLGETVARRTLEANTHYQWIYERVLNDPAIRDVNERHGFTLDQID